MLVDSLSTELVFDMHYACKTGILSLEEIYTESTTFRLAPGPRDVSSYINHPIPGAVSSGGCNEEEEELAPLDEKVRNMSHVGLEGKNTARCQVNLAERRPYISTLFVVRQFHFLTFAISVLD